VTRRNVVTANRAAGLGRIVVLSGAAAGIVVLFGFGRDFDLYVAQTVIIYSIAALGLDWLTGRAGQVSIGNAALLAVGAYTTALTSMQPWGGFFVCLALSGVIGAAVGLVIGLPSLRLSGIHLALATLALQFIVVFVANRMESSSGNVAGYPVAPLSIAGIDIDSSRKLDVVLLLILGACVIFLRNMYSRLPGRMWRAIREDEVAASTMGIDTVRWKLAAFIGSSAMVSVAGCLFAYQLQIVSSATFTLDIALGFVAMLVIGGLGSIPGVIFGATFVTVAPNLISSLLSHISSTSVGSWLEPRSSVVSSGIYGLVFLVFLLVRPDGVAGLVRSGYLAIFERLQGSSHREVATGGTAIPRPVVFTSEADRVADPVQGTLLSIRGLTCTYQNGACALRALEIDLARGEITAVVGRNGAGKSSLLRSITGFLPSEHVRVTGSIELAGRELLKLGPARSAAFGIILVPERDKVFPDLTVEDHFRALGTLERFETSESEAYEVLRRRRSSRAGFLSGGERQLLALCAAASLDPLLLLVDEMSLGLAPAMTQSVVSAVKELTVSGSTTVLVVEQNMDVARALSDRVFTMLEGKVVPAELASAGGTS
jgi:branched-chain amino acid transport system permease protein